MGTSKMPSAPGDSQKCPGLERLWFSIDHSPEEQLETESTSIWVSISLCLPHSNRLSWGHSQHKLAGKLTSPRCPSRAQAKSPDWSRLPAPPLDSCVTLNILLNLSEP